MVCIWSEVAWQRAVLERTAAPLLPPTGDGGDVRGYRLSSCDAGTPTRAAHVRNTDNRGLPMLASASLPNRPKNSVEMRLEDIQRGPGGDERSCGI